MILYMLGKTVGIITALASINLGLGMVFDIDIMRALPKSWARLLGVLVGIAGLVSLVTGFRPCP